MPAVGSTVYVTSPVQNIDQWKRYREVNGGGYVECTEDEVDYTCPWTKVGEYRVYTFQASTTFEEDLNIDDVVTYQWRPSGYDADIPDAESFYINSQEYTIDESSSMFIMNQSLQLCVSLQI